MSEFTYYLTNFWLLRRSGILLFFLLFLILIPPQLVYADTQEEIRILNFIQQDLDKDGQPDLAIIDCACFTDHDKILVYETASDMRISSDWNGGTNTIDNVWVFQMGDNGKTNLIIVFRKEQNEQIADLYDDQNGDGNVVYHYEGHQIFIDESPYWSMEIRTHGDWLIDGHPNLNIEVLIDKPVDILVLDDIAQKYMPHDGKADMSSEIIDANNDGKIDYMLTRVLSPIPSSFGVVRALLRVNVGEKESLRPATALFWPYLNMQSQSQKKDNRLRFFDELPTALIDWSHSQITGFDLIGYPIESGYSINTMQYIDKFKNNIIDFEMPHAYYDLAKNKDGMPELNIRLFTEYVETASHSPLREIRYSWNQFHSGSLIWDYKLGMMGDPEINGIVEFPDFSLKAIPYEQLPYWTTEQTWKLTTFVANEGANAESSEGIYVWTPWAGEDPGSANNPSEEVFYASASYILGFRDKPPYDYFKNIIKGYRGEYNLSGPLKPILYYSSVDQRLHLKGAEHGVLNLGNGRKVTYENKDNDDYLEQWSVYQDSVLEQQLYINLFSLIYAGKNEVTIKNTNVSPLLFETLPPRSHDEWLVLGQKILSPSVNIPADDLIMMFKQFGGFDWSVNGANLSGYRTMKDGYRFILDLNPGYAVSGKGGPNLNNLQPGKYLIEFSQNVFSIQPVVPADVQINFLSNPQNNITAYNPIVLQIQLTNPALEDKSGLTLVVTTHGPDPIEATDIYSRTISIPAGSPVKVERDWEPMQAGAWELTARLQDASGAVIAGSQLALEVGPGDPGAPARVARETSGLTLLPLASLLVSFALLCVTVISLAWPEGKASKGQ